MGILGRHNGAEPPLHGQTSQNRQLLYQATPPPLRPPQDVTDAGREARAPARSSCARPPRTN